MSEFADWIEGTAGHLGSAAAIVDAAGLKDCETVAGESAAIAHALARQGFQPGDRLAVALPPSAGHLIFLLGCFRLGMTVFPLNPRIPQETLTTLSRTAGCRTTITEEGLLSRMIAVNGPASPMPIPSHVLERAGAIVLTSGSSGEPKLALLTYRNLCHNADASNRNIPVGPGDRWLLSLPLHHVSGLGVLFRCLVGFGAVAVAEPDEPLEEAIVRYRATHVSLVAAQLRRLLNANAGIAALRGLKAVLVGGGPIPEPLLEQAWDCELPVCTTYGLTEMASQVTVTRPGDPLEVWRTSGYPLQPGTVTISPEGEVLVRGEALFAGYVDGDNVHRPMTEDGWFATGDLGAFDEGGRLCLTGRWDNRFISGGENIYPEEIERELCRIRGIAEAIVVPIDDVEFGQRPVAFIRADTPQSQESLVEVLSRRLPRFKIPDVIFPWPEDLAPRGLKPRRALFRQRAEELIQRQ